MGRICSSRASQGCACKEVGLGLREAWDFREKWDETWPGAEGLGMHPYQQWVLPPNCLSLTSLPFVYSRSTKI